MMDYLSTAEFAALAGIGERGASKALKRALVGKEWNTHALIVRKRGKAYEVFAPSLPPDLYAKLLAAQPKPPAPVQEPVQLPATLENQHNKLTAPEKWPEANWKRALIEPALAYPASTKARGSFIKDIAAREHTKPCGKVVRIPARTLYQWIEQFETLGIGGLVRKRRHEKGPRVLISRRWDAECPLPADKKGGLKAAIETYIKSLWANAAPGWPDVARFGQTELMRLSHEAGWPDASLENCKLTRHFVEKFNEWRLVHMAKKDFKQLFDKHRSRVIRDSSLLQPMQMVVGDVHPVDILVTRPDGSTATPRLIAWYDVATHRIFATLTLLDKDKGITRADVWASFAAMVETWGLPERLYLDNGSEYNGRKRRFGKGQLAGVIEGFNLLSSINLSMRELIGVLWREFTAEIVEQASAVEMLGSGVTRSQPYNAPGKPGIEGQFASLEKVMAMLDGYIGGNRMKKRTPKLGKETPAWGSAAEFEAAFKHALDFWHNKEQAGDLKGKSPNQALDDAQKAGWRASCVDRGTLIYAMSETLQRTVQTCGVEVDNQWYENSAAFAGLRQQKATFRYASWAPERIVYAPNFPDPEGWALIERAKVYDHRDMAGARDASARNGKTLNHISSLKAETVPLVLAAEMARDVAARPPAPKTLFGGPKISLGIHVDALAESAERLGLPAPQEIIPLQPSESVDRETGEVTHGLDHINPPRRRRTEERDPFAMLDDLTKKQGAGR
ncbi:MAG: hypothetical protein K0M58_00595 [Thiobacillus sp.]|nr:hypothetical protein [Thiobacillus sp.]